jgi:hypothetical protein
MFFDCLIERYLRDLILIDLGWFTFTKYFQLEIFCHFDGGEI